MVGNTTFLPKAFPTFGGNTIFLPEAFPTFGGNTAFLPEAFPPTGGNTTFLSEAFPPTGGKNFYFPTMKCRYQITIIIERTIVQDVLCQESIADIGLFTFRRVPEKALMLINELFA